jgi:hypothetical protein
MRRTPDTGDSGRASSNRQFLRVGIHPVIVAVSQPRADSKRGTLFNGTRFRDAEVIYIALV